MSGTTLELKIIKAEFVKDTDAVGKMDPYIVIKHGEQKQETKIAKGAGKNPDFNENFKFQLNPAEPFVLDAYEDDMGRDDYLGQAVLTIDRIQDILNQATWIDLQNLNQPAGRILIEPSINQGGSKQAIRSQQSLKGKSNQSIKDEGKKAAAFQENYNLDQRLVAVPTSVSNKQRDSLKMLNSEADKPQAANVSTVTHTSDLNKLYEDSGLNDALAKGLQEVGDKKPENPVQHLANFLLNYKK